MPIRRAASRELLDRICRAAAELIVEKGFECTTLTEVGRAVGLAKSGLYHHIQSKEDLLYQVMRHGLSRLDEGVIAPTRAITDPAERLRAIANRYGEFILGSRDGSGVGPQLTTLIHESKGLSPEHLREVARSRLYFYKYVAATMQELMNQGRFAQVDPTVAAMSFFGAMVWLARWYRPGGRLSREAVIADVVEMTVNRLILPAHRSQGVRIG